MFGKNLETLAKPAVDRYLATVEGKISWLPICPEIANSYYELLSLDNQLDIIRQTIKIQKNALEVVKIKRSARSTELAVQKFQAKFYQPKIKNTKFFNKRKPKTKLTSFGKISSGNS